MEELNEKFIKEIITICNESNSEEEAFEYIMANYSLTEDQANSYIRKHFYGRVQESEIISNSKSIHIE